MMMPSIKYGQENFTLVLDNVLKWCSIEKAAAASNIDSWTIGRWRIRSENGDEPFQEVEYRGLIQPFHIHFEDCILNSTDEIESNFRANARDGYFRPIIWHGEYQYEPDEAAEGMSTKEFADALDLGLAWPDKKRRTFNEATGQWERVKMMEWIAPSVDAQMKILSSWSDKYADKRSLRIDGNINQTYGVTVMGTPLQPPPELLQLITPEISSAVNEAATEAVFNEVQPEPDSEPSPLTAEQDAILDRLKSPNPLVRDLAEKAQENLQRRIAAGLEPDLDPRRTGRGPPPRGYKVG